MRIALSLVVLAALAASAAAAPVRRIVVFDSSIPASQRVRVAATSGGRVVRELPLINAVVVESRPGVSIMAAEARLKANPSIKRVDADPKINWLAMVSAPTLKPFVSSRV
ncbi:MAG: hypothetical protein KGL53_04840, partial [Elusimicrobia bacterium]|nr:hypothetical protein [Elusimicrobiota bacterium]